MYEDECHFRDGQTVHKTWFKKGQQKKVIVSGAPIFTSMFGAVNALSGEFLYQTAEKCNAQSFQVFLETILETHKGKKVIMVLDNARYHHAKVLQPFLEENSDRLTLFFLPPYSPNLNMIERVWKLVKESVLANCFYENLTCMIQAIQEFSDNLAANPERVLSRIQQHDLSVFNR
jgi:transposase